MNSKSRTCKDVNARTQQPYVRTAETSSCRTAKEWILSNETIWAHLRENLGVPAIGIRCTCKNRT